MRKITVMVSDKVFEAIEQVQREELEKGNKISISKIASNWMMYYLGCDVKKYFPNDWTLE